MRTARKKMIGRSCYYHCCARINGAMDDYLFTDVDKEKGMWIVKDLARLFYIEPISMAWMGNHWHIVLYAPEKSPSIDEAVERYNSFYKNKTLNVEYAPDECARVADCLVDISAFIGQIHQRFTNYINKVHKRRGTLWADRFKSTILQDQTALWDCVKYVELNPVRAGLSDDPANYRFCTWGYYCGTGKHMFGDNFIRHMRRYLGEIAKNWSDEEVCAEFRCRLARTISYESGAEENEVRKAAKEARKRESMPIRFLRRTRHWTDGAIIGTKAFVMEVGTMFENEKRIRKKRFSSGKNSDGNLVHCFKRLRLNYS